MAIHEGTCTYVRVRLPTVSENESHASRYTTMTYEPMERLNIDHQGPFPEDENGNCYILAIIDSFTRWIELYPTKTTGAEETAQCILQHTGRFGCPLQLLSDNGPAFVNEVIKNLANLMGIEWLLTIAYSKQENAIVERSHRESLRHLRGILNHRKVRNKWSAHLPFVQRIMNASIKERLGVSPGQLLFGNAIRLDNNILRVPKELSEISPEGRPVHRWLADNLRMQQNILDIARETQLATEIDRFDKPKEEGDTFPSGTFVLLQDPEGTNKSKLLPLHPGPYEVMGHIRDKYEVRNLVDNGVTYVHISRLRKFNYDPIHTDPNEVALQDNQEFIVEKILDHEGTIMNKTQMRFLVKWLGFDDTANSWEPWYDNGSGLRDNKVLHQYLRDRGWGFIIPKAQQVPGDKRRPPHTKSNKNT